MEQSVMLKLDTTRVGQELWVDPTAIIAVRRLKPGVAILTLSPGTEFEVAGEPEAILRNVADALGYRLTDEAGA